MSAAEKEDMAYRRLRKHLDDQAVGFPATRSGAEIRFLKRLFTSDEARAALLLTYKPTSGVKIIEKAAGSFPPEQLRMMFDSMFSKGAIGWKKKEGIDHWYLIPMVVGMYEAQDGNPTAEFLADAGAFLKTAAFGKSILAVSPSQMRTIPVNRSIPVEQAVASYDQIREIVRNSPGPFVVLKCICRESKAIRGKRCKKTSRQETCLGFGSVAAMVLRRKHGRELSRDEVLEILEQNEKDGLVLQPGNAQDPEFVCSCCGCCCGMLSMQKMLPRPLDFWTISYQAELSMEKCQKCGLCVKRCQVKAITMTGPERMVKINPIRCIGCGLCVSVCPGKSIRLRKVERAAVPPRTDEDLYEKIKARKKSRWGQIVMLLKIMLRMRQG